MQFDRSVKLAFQGSSISSDGGLLLHRELDDALNLTDIAAELIADPRTGSASPRGSTARLVRRPRCAVVQFAEAALPGEVLPAHSI